MQHSTPRQGSSNPQPAKKKKPAGERGVRSLARERAMQCVFGLDFTGYEWSSIMETFWTENPSRPPVKEFAEMLIQGVISHVTELDSGIDNALDNWLPERVGRIERTILRMALFELRYCPEIPKPVTINEAIELAKRFGGDESPRFINGVLDRLLRDATKDTATTVKDITDDGVEPL